MVSSVTPPTMISDGAKDDDVKLEVMTDFLDRLGLQDRPQQVDRLTRIDEGFADRAADGDVGGLAGRPRDRDADQIAGPRPRAGRLGVDRDPVA